MKRCSTCRETLPIAAFCKNRSQRDGLANNCRACHASANRKWNDGSPRRQLSISLSRALKRRPTPDPITVQGLMDLWEAQKGKCAISGIPMVFRLGSVVGASISIDRIEQSSGYEVGNVRLICNAINSFRGIMDDAEMLRMAQAIVMAYTCSECGTVDRRSRESQASFSCQHCGFRAHADHNAAINILRRNTASMRMEEGHQLSGEVRTGSRLALAENPPPSGGGRC